MGADVLQVTARTPYEDLPQQLTPKAFSIAAGVSIWTIYEQIKAGTLPAKKYGRSIRIPKTALLVKA